RTSGASNSGGSLDQILFSGSGFRAETFGVQAASNGQVGFFAARNFFTDFLNYAGRRWADMPAIMEGLKARVHCPMCTRTVDGLAVPEVRLGRSRLRVMPATCSSCCRKPSSRPQSRKAAIARRNRTSANHPLPVGPLRGGANWQFRFMAPIQTIIFDLGNTLIPFSLALLRARWGDGAAEAAELCNRLESGRMPSAMFRSRMCAL